MHSVALSLLATLSVLTLTRTSALGQEGAASEARGPLVERQAEGRLSGHWDAEFRLDTVWGGVQPGGERVARGNIVMHPVPHLSPGADVSRSVHPGRFDVDFSDFGFELTSRDALGWYVGKSEARLRLHPAVGGGGVQMNGVFDGDSVTGTWRRDAPNGGAAGRFTLRRAGASGR